MTLPDPLERLYLLKIKTNRKFILAYDKRWDKANRIFLAQRTYTYIFNT